MTLAERRSGDVAIVDVDGRITDDEDADIRLRETLKNLVMQGHTALLLNLERVPFVDSAGLGAVAYAYISAKRRGGTVKLLRVSGRVHELLTITRLASVLEMFDGEAEAVASFAKPPE
jgi:anti-sigma B factor antagonist